MIWPKPLRPAVPGIEFYMGDNHTDSIDPTGSNRPVQIDDAWIGEFDHGLGWNDKPRSYRLLNAVLHAIRESLPADEMADPGVGIHVRPILGDFLEEGLLMLNQSCEEVELGRL